MHGFAALRSFGWLIAFLVSQTAKTVVSRVSVRRLVGFGTVLDSHDVLPSCCYRQLCDCFAISIVELELTIQSHSSDASAAWYPFTVNLAQLVPHCCGQVLSINSSASQLGAARCLSSSLQSSQPCNFLVDYPQSHRVHCGSWDIPSGSLPFFHSRSSLPCSLRLIATHLTAIRRTFWAPLPGCAICFELQIVPSSE